MVMAQLHGKLSGSAWQRKEDMLTGAVLGVIKNLDDALMQSIVASASALSPDCLAPFLMPPLKWEFWPQWSECEPDVVIRDSAGKMIVVEVKLYSKFGVAEQTEQLQLAREWRDAVREAGNGDFWLLALTNHAAMPRETLRRQLVGTACHLSRVLWLSWLEVGRALRYATDGAVRRWRDNLLELLLSARIVPFDGFEYQEANALASVHWLAEFALPVDVPPPAGFADALAAAAVADDARGAIWERLWSRARPRVGFATSLGEAAELDFEEDAQWQLKL